MIASFQILLAESFHKLILFNQLKKVLKSTYVDYLDYNYCAQNSMEVHQVLQGNIHVKQLFTAKIANLLDLKINRKIKQKTFFSI